LAWVVGGEPLLEGTARPTSEAFLGSAGKGRFFVPA
jgi:hypothetical protein